MAEVVRDKFVRQTKIGRFAVDAFFLNEDRLLERFHATDLREDDVAYARKLFAKYRQQGRDAFVQGENAEERLTQQHLRDARAALKRAQHYMSKDEVKASERLFALANEHAVGKNARELLALMNDEKLYKEVQEIISTVEFIKTRQEPASSRSDCGWAGRGRPAARVAPEATCDQTTTSSAEGHDSAGDRAGLAAEHAGNLEAPEREPGDRPPDLRESDPRARRPRCRADGRGQEAHHGRAALPRSHPRAQGGPGAEAGDAIAELGLRTRLPLSPPTRWRLLFDALELEPLEEDSGTPGHLPVGRTAAYAELHPVAAMLAEYERVRRGVLVFQSKASYQAFKRGEKVHAWVERVTFDV